MKLFQNIIYNSVFAINILLLFFLLVENMLVLPAWLQVVGRMHPLLLHLPIGLLLLFALLPFLKKSLGAKALYEIQLFVLTLTSISAALAALMGFFLARENGYSGELLDQHKWTGIGLSWMVYGLLLWLRNRPQTGRGFQVGVMASVLVLILVGHLGASITHGADFVLAPIQSKERLVTEDTPVYEALIVPVLEQKCFSCHNERKAKGDLIMTTPEHFERGGETGKAFIIGDSEQSLFVQRVELPLAEEEHMPPDGKPQLSEVELTLLKNWIDSGADTIMAIKELPDDHLLKANAVKVLADANKEGVKKYNFSPAPESVIEELNIPFRTVTPLSLGSPALSAAIFIRETYQPEFLSDLVKVKEQLVDLKLDYLPIKDDELSTIANFINLEKLNLNNTAITGQNLETLGDCKNLEFLALSGIPIDTNIASTLRLLPKLQELFVWNTKLDRNGSDYLKEQFPAINFELGYVPEEGELLQLSPPVVKTKINLAGREEIHLQHSFPGATIRYTIDGSDPDSTESLIYEEPLLPTQYAVVKARAFRENWLGSEITSTTFFPASIPMKKADLLTTPNKKYRGTGAPGLIDGQKGFASNFQSPLWLGFRQQPFSALFYPEDPTTPIASITMSYLQSMGSYIMTPVRVEVWGGNDAEHLQLIKRLKPAFPKGYGPTEIKGLDIAMDGVNWPCYKIVAYPVASLPSWHAGAGDNGWVFVDEVYFYENTNAILVPQVGD